MNNNIDNNIIYYEALEKAFIKKEDRIYLLGKKMSPFGTQSQINLIEIENEENIISLGKDKGEMVERGLWLYSQCVICQKKLPIANKKRGRTFCYQNGESCKTSYNALKKQIKLGKFLSEKKVWGFSPKRGSRETPLQEEWDFVAPLDVGEELLKAKKFEVKLRAHRAKINIIKNSDFEKNFDESQKKYVYFDSWDNDNYIVVESFIKGEVFINTNPSILVLAVRLTLEYLKLKEREEKE